MRCEAGEIATYEVRHPDLLRDCDGGGLGEPFAVRWGAVRVPGGGGEDTVGDVPEDTGCGIWGRGEAADSAGHICPERGVLRRLLPEGATGEDPADPGFPGGVCGCRCAGSSRDANSGVQAGREDGRSGEDVPRGHLLGGGEPGRNLWSVRAVRYDEGRTADRGAGNGKALR